MHDLREIPFNQRDLVRKEVSNKLANLKPTESEVPAESTPPPTEPVLQQTPNATEAASPESQEAAPPETQEAAPPKPADLEDVLKELDSLETTEAASPKSPAAAPTETQEAASPKSPEAAAPKTTGEIKGLWQEAKTVGKVLKKSFLLVQGEVGHRKPQMKEGLGKLKTKLSEAKSKISERKTNVESEKAETDLSEVKGSSDGLKGVHLHSERTVIGEIKTYDAVNIPEMAKGMGNKKLTDEQFKFLYDKVMKDFDDLVTPVKKENVTIQVPLPAPSGIDLKMSANPNFEENDDLGGEVQLPMIYSLIQNLGKNMKPDQKKFLLNKLQERANEPKNKKRLKDGFAVVKEGVADLYTSDQSAIGGELDEMCGKGTAETLNNLLIQHKGNVYSILSSMCQEFLGKPLEEPPAAAPTA